MFVCGFVLTWKMTCALRKAISAAHGSYLKLSVCVVKASKIHIVKNGNNCVFIQKIFYSPEPTQGKDNPSKWPTLVRSVFSLKILLDFVSHLYQIIFIARYVDCLKSYWLKRSRNESFSLKLSAVFLHSFLVNLFHHCVQHYSRHFNPSR